jgi:hypothetical protein
MAFPPFYSISGKALLRILPFFIHVCQHKNRQFLPTDKDMSRNTDSVPGKYALHALLKTM